MKKIIDFTDDLSSGDKFNFEAKIIGRYSRIYPASFRDTIANHEHLKQRYIKHYVVLDTQIPIKVPVTGLPGYTNTELL